MLALGLKDSMDLMKDPTSVGTMINREEEVLRKLSGVFTPRYLPKIKDLAHYMVTREVRSQNLLRNSIAIAKLLGEQGKDTVRINALYSDDLVKSISRLTSLYAFQGLDPVVQKSLKNLITDESEGMESLMAYHRSTRQAELERQDRHGGKNMVAEYNGWKGYTPSVRQDGATVVIEDDSKNYDMLELGYVRIGDYVGDAREAYQGKRGYYQSSVGGQNPFRQGVLTYCKTERSSQPDAHVKDIVKIHPIPSLTKQIP